MGIRQLQTYMQKHVPEGYTDVSIIQQCEEYFKKHSERPVIVIDLMGLVNMVLSGALILCGGRHNLYKLYYEDLLSNLSNHAQLIFFIDGPVVNQKFDTWAKRQNDRYDNCIQIIDLVNQGMPIEDILQLIEPGSKTTHLSVIKHAAKKFGEIITTVTAECDTEIARYASLNPKVIAVMADDSDFLIYTGNWRYFSLREMDPKTLMTKEYNRKALRSCLQLNDCQMIIFATLCSNDIIKFEEVEQFHKYLVGPRNLFTKRFEAVSQYIKENLPAEGSKLIRAIADQVFLNPSTRMMEKIQESLEMFNIYFDIHEPIDPLLKLCRSKHYDFTYSILMKMKKNFTLMYHDLRVPISPSMHEMTTKLFRKQIGIVLQHEQRDIKYEIAAKTSHQDIYRKHYVEPIYPTSELPPLIEFLQRDLFPEHDQARFELLKWTISDQKIFRKVDIQRIPKNYFLDILVLSYMVDNRLIEPKEADLILLSIKHVNTDTVPEQLAIPDLLNPRAFQITFLFTKFHSMIHRSLEVVGLKMLKKVLNFDGVMFHYIYSKSQTQDFNVDFLINELVQYCPYK